jgi:HD-GYP domain-containing protein (c-di-GMP phosphodiesterase class II)
MALAGEFSRFSRLFQDSGPVSTASIRAQETHSEIATQWMDLTAELEAVNRLKQKRLDQVLTRALGSARILSGKGDEITAWLGFIRISSAAEKCLPGPQAALYLGEVALRSAQLLLHDHVHHFLYRMSQNFKNSNHPIAVRYWELRGLGLQVRKNWLDAVPSYQLSLEHLDSCTNKELDHYFQKTRNDFAQFLLARIADSYINESYLSEKTERQKHVREAEKYVHRILRLDASNTNNPLVTLKLADINLLKGNPEDARQTAEAFLKRDNLSSRKLAALRPRAHFTLARIADEENNRSAMIAHITQALAESLHFPGAIYELLVVDQALDMIREHALRFGEMSSILEAMVIMLEAKDWYTGRDHSKSVVEYTQKLWRKWHPEQNDEPLMKDLYWAGYLHDIGKLRLPRSLLNKVSALGDEEWRLIRQHPSHSEDILNRFGLNRIASLTRQHHQDSQGTGYPGHEPASPMGMCIAIADFLEAATNSNRRYKKPKTFSEAIEELKQFGRERYPDELIEAAASLTPNQ